MAKNGKKSFLDYFKINDSSDEYEDDYLMMMNMMTMKMILMKNMSQSQRL